MGKMKYGFILIAEKENIASRLLEQNNVYPVDVLGKLLSNNSDGIIKEIIRDNGNSRGENFIIDISRHDVLYVINIEDSEKFTHLNFSQYYDDDSVLEKSELIEIITKVFDSFSDKGSRGIWFMCLGKFTNVERIPEVKYAEIMEKPLDNTDNSLVKMSIRFVQDIQDIINKIFIRDKRD